MMVRDGNSNGCNPERELARGIKALRRNCHRKKDQKNGSYSSSDDWPLTPESTALRKEAAAQQNSIVLNSQTFVSQRSRGAAPLRTHDSRKVFALHVEGSIPDSVSVRPARVSSPPRLHLRAARKLRRNRGCAVAHSDLRLTPRDLPRGPAGQRCPTQLVSKSNFAQS